MTPGSGKIYRLRRTYLRQGIGYGSFFLVLAIVTPFAAINGLGALIFALFWSFWVLLSAWMIAAYYHERLILERQTIVQHGIFRIKRFEHCEVRQVYWNPMTIAGIIVVKTLAERIKIYLDNFTEPERAEIVQYVRTNFAETMQENWPAFDACIPRSKIPPKPVSPNALWLLIAILMAFTVANMIAWWYGLGAQFLVASLINVIVLLYCRRRQRTAQQEPPPSEVA